MKFYVYNKNRITDCSFQLIENKEFLIFLAVKFLHLLVVLTATAGVFYFHSYLGKFILPIIITSRSLPCFISPLTIEPKIKAV